MGSVLISASRIVVVMPNWLGDGVMATPFLRALRGAYPEAHIAAVARPLVAPVLAGLGEFTTEALRHGEKGWVDEVKVYEKGQEKAVVRWMREGRFELGILLPNSFRSAWMMWRGGVRRRLGYARGGRSFFLSDRMRAQRRSRETRQEDGMRAAARAFLNEHDLRRQPVPFFQITRVGSTSSRYRADFTYIAGAKTETASSSFFFPYFLFAPLQRAYEPVPTVEYYLELARYLEKEGKAYAGDAQRPTPSETAGLGEWRKMTLGVTGEEREEAERELKGMGIEESDAFVVMVPGANFGASKCWMPERFAEVADRLANANGAFGAKVVLASSPSELPLVEAILAACTQKERIVATAKMNGGKGISIGALKEIVRRSALMVCNDTGPRHFAAAFGVPLVTLFGPTDPVWAETYAANERIVRINVPCGPCQLKKCPIDHRCMKGISVEMVIREIAALWPRGSTAPGLQRKAVAEAGE